MKRENLNFTFFLLMCLTFPPLVTAQIINIPEPVPPPATVRDAFDLDPFYQQWIDVEGFPVVASAKVNPYALKEAAWLIRQMIGHRPEVIEALVQRKVRFVVIGHTEIPTELPDYSDQGPDFLVFRTRGFGGSGLSGHPAVSSSEENLLHYPGGGGSYTVLIHELAHAIHLFGLKTVAPTFDNRLEIAYNTAMAKGLWQGTYASSDRREYWAEATQAWFNTEDAPDDNSYNRSHVNTRTELKNYDPPLAALLAEIYGDGNWRYTPPAARIHLPHLHGFNPDDVPTFMHPPELEELERQFRNPNSDGGDKWVDLRPYDLSLLPILNESRTVGTPTHISFMNLTQGDVLVYEVGRNGREYFWTQIPSDPRYIRGIPSKTNDIWLIKESNGKNLAVFQSVEKTGRALIGGAPLITPGLSKVSGENQTGVSGAVLGNPFVVEVRDESGSALEGISVIFAVTAGGGTLNVTRATTDKNGSVQSTLTLGPNLGTHAVEVSVAGTDHTVTFIAVAEEAIDILDASLRAAVENTFGKAEGDSITPSEMAALTHLEASEAGVRDLTGLESAINLTSLNVDLNSVKDLSPLTGLTNLTGLYLVRNSASDLSPLRDLTNLQDLFIDTNGISDLSPLAGLTNLSRLALNNNSISDLSPLAGLTNLKWMRLVSNKISDLSPLVVNMGLGNGDEVDIRSNPLSYLSLYIHIPALQSRGVDVQFDAGATRPPDVNNDGSVNILDLILIASELGNAGANLAADVSGDGVVNILDLILAAGMFDGAAAAPSAHPEVPETLTAVEVHQWLTDARALEVRNPITKRGFVVLEQLLVSLTPRETELLANYPNPFNPETWIPYRLAEDAFVTLTIYNGSGRVVRTLDVGHRIASAYESRSKAIYWNGRNELGERVASGVFFYHLSAGDYSAMRKMVILK